MNHRDTEDTEKELQSNLYVLCASVVGFTPELKHIHVVDLPLGGMTSWKRQTR
jgi:hypothetical protein